jgi:hypothetical protein
MKTISYSEMLKMLNAQDLMSKKDKELVSLREQLAQTQKQLASAKTPNMFWDAENPEECQFDVRDVFESYFCESTKLGLQVVIQQAVSIPNVTYRLIELNDDGTFEIENLTDTTVDKSK